ncbi:hypothetical protein CH352_01125 [Leptospira hartskeerlii]|uniref:Uncharacterized protein n=1 Tax=Leptospira hartskeerlii TaxID=2023177 RepID=A0A2M9XEA8_9LEPT|nr:hypothetical protein CH357_09850 [Leptospira hartskeerlii]PJZ35263.1 hypothetical protein CH352_01125 [Leptospira hartskeerlii]
MTFNFWLGFRKYERSVPKVYQGTSKTIRGKKNEELYVQSDVFRKKEVFWQIYLKTGNSCCHVDPSEEHEKDRYESHI